MSVENILRLTEILADNRISFDIDGVVFDTHRRVTEMFNKAYGTNYKIGEWRQYYEIIEWFRRLGSGNPETDARDFFNRADVVGGAVPTKGALLVLNHIYRAGVKPFFISSRPGVLYQNTLASFDKWLPWVDGDQIVMSNDNSRQINSKLKVREINRKGIVYHFEDSYEHALDIVTKTRATVILVRQPYNEQFSIDGVRILRPEQGESTSSLLHSYRLLASKIQSS